MKPIDSVMNDLDEALEMIANARAIVRQIKAQAEPVLQEEHLRRYQRLADTTVAARVFLDNTIDWARENVVRLGGKP